MDIRTIEPAPLALQAYRLLAAGDDLAAVRRALSITCSVQRLRCLILDGARSEEFVKAVAADTPIELASAVQRLLTSWPAVDTDEHVQFRRLRRALVAVDQLRNCFTAGLSAEDS